MSRKPQENALFQAIANNNQKHVIETLTDQPDRIYERNNEDQTLVQAAMENGHFDLARVLHEQFDLPFTFLNDGDGPLNLAAGAGNTDMTLYLLNLDELSCDSILDQGTLFPPFISALENNRIEAAIQIHKRQGLNCLEGMSPMDAYQCVIDNNNLDAFILLQKMGFTMKPGATQDPDDDEISGFSPLMYCALVNNKKIAKHILQDQPSSANWRYGQHKEGETALDIAKRSSHIGMTKLLQFYSTNTLRHRLCSTAKPSNDEEQPEQNQSKSHSC